MSLADVTDPRFTDAQRQQLAAFEGAEYPAEVVEAGDVVERVARALWEEADGARVSWDESNDWWREKYLRLAAAAITAMPVLAPQAEFTRNEVTVRLDRDIVGDNR